MLTSDDLKRIQGVVEKVVDKRVEETELKMELRFDAVEKRFEGVDKRFDKLEKQMDQDRKDWSQFFNEAGIFFDQLVKRIKKLEENQRISKNY